MIPFFDYRPEYRRLRSEIDAAIARVLDSGFLILGPEVRAFEDEFAAYVGARAAVGTNSGTDAIVLALRALGVSSGAEVITVANAGVPPVAAIRAVGALPRFVDVDPVTLQMDPHQMEQVVGPRTRCVLAVHLYGHPAPLEAVLAFARRYELPLVEDCAQAHGARYRRRHVGTWGSVGCFSFYPTKNLGAYGDAGLCVTDDPELAARLRRMRMYGFGEERSSIDEGINSRLDELQAAILRVKLAHLDEILERRIGQARRYLSGLRAGPYGLPVTSREARHVFHLFVIRAADRQRVIDSLDDRGIGWAVHYPTPVHRMPAYEFLGYAAGSLPVTEEICSEVLSLPLYSGIEDSTIDRVIEALLGAG